MLRMLIFHLLEDAILTTALDPAVTTGPAEARSQPPDANTHPVEAGRSCLWAQVSIRSLQELCPPTPSLVFR